MSDNDKQQELEELKAGITTQLENLSDNLDEETLEKLHKINRSLKEKHGQRPDENIEELNKLNAGLSFYQRFKQSFESNLDADPSRLMALSDGIFGIVMTLLIFGMVLPEFHLATAGDFLDFLHSIAPTFGVTVVSFILLSSFWIYHHEFIRIKNINIPFLWYNIFFLACISFIPFSTSLIGSYSQFFLAEVIFGINIFLVLFTFLLVYRYAYNHGFLENEPSNDEKKYVYNTFFIIMILTVIVNLLDFNISNNFIYLFLLVPIISTIRDIRYKMK